MTEAPHFPGVLGGSPLRSAKGFLREHMPLAAATYDQLRTYWRARKWRSLDARAAFQSIYDRNFWGDAESLSGDGSSLARTATIRRELPILLEQLCIHSLLDAPCGDLHWFSKSSLRLSRYIGMDIVPALIERNRHDRAEPGRDFLCGDICSTPLPSTDAVLCRDCLVHLSYDDIWRALRNFRNSGATYLLTTTFTAHRWNVNCFTGHWRPLNLQRSPFSFPAPLALVSEDYHDVAAFRDKQLGVWRFADLPLCRDT